MGQSRRLQIRLNPNWEEVTNPKTLTFMRRGRTNNNAFQVSFAISASRKPHLMIPTSTVVTWAEGIGGSVIKVSSGEVRFGEYASATFTWNEFVYCQAWFLTDGVDTVQSTFICDGPPSLIELSEVAEMATRMTFAEVAQSNKRRWWRL